MSYTTLRIHDPFLTRIFTLLQDGRLPLAKRSLESERPKLSFSSPDRKQHHVRNAWIDADVESGFLPGSSSRYRYGIIRSIIRSSLYTTMQFKIYCPL